MDGHELVANFEAIDTPIALEIHREAIGGSLGRRGCNFLDLGQRTGEGVNFYRESLSFASG